MSDEAECPGCEEGSFVTSRTDGMGEAECLRDACPVVIFKVDA